MYSGWGITVTPCFAKGWRTGSVVTWRIVVMQHPQSVLPTSCPIVPHWLVRTSHNLQIKLLIDRLALRRPFEASSPTGIEKRDDYDSHIRLHLPCFFGVGELGDFRWDDRRFVSISTVSPSFIIFNDFFKKPLSFSALANSSFEICIVLFLIFAQEARDKLRSDATHARIFCQNVRAGAVQ